MSKLLTYLDTNILSRMVDFRASAATALAYGELARIGGIKFVTSEKTGVEILKTTNPQRSGVLLLLVALVEKVPSETARDNSAEDVRATPLYQNLATIFDPDDAEHIFHAVNSHCSFFLTLDDASILSRVRERPALVARFCPELNFVSPENLVTLLKASKSGV